MKLRPGNIYDGREYTHFHRYTGYCRHGGKLEPLACIHYTDGWQVYPVETVADLLNENDNKDIHP